MASIYFGHLDDNASAPDFAIDGPGGPNAPSAVREISPGLGRAHSTGRSVAAPWRCRSLPVSISVDGTWLTMRRRPDDACSRGEFRPAHGSAMAWPTTTAGRPRRPDFDPTVLVHPACRDGIGGGGSNGVMTADRVTRPSRSGRTPTDYRLLQRCHGPSGTPARHRPVPGVPRGPTGLTVRTARDDDRWPSSRDRRHRRQVRRPATVLDKSRTPARRT